MNCHIPITKQEIKPTLYINYFLFYCTEKNSLTFTNLDVNLFNFAHE